MNNEPLWKTVLNWGTVVVFFTLPLFMMCVQIYANTHPGWWQWHEKNLTPAERLDRFRYLSDYMRNLTILVFGLAGLRTWEHMKQNGNGKQDGTK